MTAGPAKVHKLGHFGYETDNYEETIAWYRSTSTCGPQMSSISQATHQTMSPHSSGSIWAKTTVIITASSSLAVKSQARKYTTPPSKSRTSTRR